MNKSYAVILLSLIIFVSGCASAPNTLIPQQPAQQTPQQQAPQQPATKQFTVIISHTAYSPNSFEVNKGDTIRFLAVAAKGTGIESGFNHNHGITIDEYGINAVVASENTPTVIEFLADKAGIFNVYCKTCWDGPFGRNHPDIRATLIVK